MLYLPAGWFHNVTSFTDTADDGSDAKPVRKGHMAFNYWFHPPNLASLDGRVGKDTAGTFEKPYHHEFWVQDWAMRMKDRKQAEAKATSSASAAR